MAIKEPYIKTHEFTSLKTHVVVLEWMVYTETPRSEPPSKKMYEL